MNLLDSHRFIWLGRTDFVINSGGVKLFPEQIEKKLMPLIERNFFVWKEEDKILGEKLVLVVEGEPFDLPGLAATLDKIERPKAIYFVPRFQFTPTGKVKRKETFASID